MKAQVPIGHIAGGAWSLIPSKPLIALLLACVALESSASAVEPCRIEVVEKGSGWPVPLVELRTTHNVRLVTDNAGVIALDLPELMGRETWFDVIGHGYEVPKDGFGYRGVRLTAGAGQDAQGGSDPHHHCQTSRPADRRPGYSPKARSSAAIWTGGVGRVRLRQRAERGASRQALLGLGRHHPAALSAGHFRHEQRHDRRAAAAVLRAAAAAEVRLLHRRRRAARGRGQDARQRPDVGERLMSVCPTRTARRGWSAPMSRSSRRWKPTSAASACGTMPRPASSGTACSGQSRRPRPSSRPSPEGHPAFWKDAARQGLGVVRQSAARRCAARPRSRRGRIHRLGKCSSRRRPWPLPPTASR